MSQELEVVEDGPVVGSGAFIDAALQPYVLDDYAIDTPIKDELEATDGVTEATKPGADALTSSASQAISKLGGPQTAIAVANILDATTNELERFQELVPADIQAEMFWSRLNDPRNTQTILSDASVREVISRELLMGHAIEDVQALLSEYEPGNLQKRTAEIEAERVFNQQASLEVQKEIFIDVAKEVASRFGVSDSDDKVMMAQYLAQYEFLKKHNGEYLTIETANRAGHKLQVAVHAARLKNAFQASLLKQYEAIGIKSGSKPKTKAAAVKTETKPVELDPLDMTDAAYGKRFAAEFRKSMTERGL